VQAPQDKQTKQILPYVTMVAKMFNVKYKTQIQKPRSNFLAPSVFNTQYRRSKAAANHVPPANFPASVSAVFPLQAASCRTLA
jgi:hypothetical protein